MDWQQQRRQDLEQRLFKIVELLGECENKLIDESDPQRVSKLKSQITEFKEKQKECQSDLDACVQEQERGATRTLALKMASINFEDIDFVIKALLRQRVTSTEGSDNFRPTDPEQKMSKNGLTSSIRFSLDMGLAKASEVRHLIENNAKVNFPDVPDRLKSVLNAEYLRLVEEGIQGDELFKRLHEFSSCKNPDLSCRAAGLAILCYFFETCDVFEP